MVNGIVPGLLAPLIPMPYSDLQGCTYPARAYNHEYMPSWLNRRGERLAQRMIVVLALLTFFLLALGTALAKSPTNDEPVHIVRGLALRQTGDLSLQYEHTPLSHRLIGALLTTEPGLPALNRLDSWATGDRLAIAEEFLWRSGVDVDRLLLLSRLPIIYTGLLLGAVLALWVKRVARSTGAGQGSRKRLAALAVVMILYATSANLLASAALATTDFVATVTYFATVCAWWFYWQRPSRRRWVLTGLLLGLALAAKLTGVLLVPLLVLLAYVYPPRHPWWRPGTVALALLPVALGVLWAVYAFQVGLWRGRLVPAPAYWESWTSVLSHVAGGHQAFFLGQLSAEGWWLYFPVTFLLKTPVVVLLLLAVSLIVLVRHRSTWPIVTFTLLPVIMLFAVAAYSRLNIGYRHILPTVPFLLVLIGAAVPLLWTKRVAQWAIGAGLAWTVIVALYQHPHHLAYFNELAGGPARGYRYLGDSNLDWGQDLKGLANYAWKTGQDMFISYYGPGDPVYYGLDQPPLAGASGVGAPGFHPANPAAGRYAISAGHWQGLLPEADLFDWFRRQAPVDTIGYSILVYDVAAAQPGEWIAQCLAPGPFLSPTEAENLVGQTNPRHLAFDCETAWVFPNDGRPGWYILPIHKQGWWFENWPGPKPVTVYRHHANQFAPAYEVYYWPGRDAPPSALGLPATDPLATGPAELMGYVSGESEWLTLWRVATATADPLSVQAHLYENESDSAPLVADGLGFASEQWQPGDWFVQRHVFSAPGDVLETGLYNYLTLEPAGPITRLPAR